MRLPLFGRLRTPSAVVTALILGCLTAPVAAVQGQVGSVAASPPILSPVAVWSAHRDANPGALANSLTVLINSGANQTLTSLVNNRINTFPTPVSITTQWQFSAIVTRVDLVGYFANPAAALSNGANRLESGRMEGRMISGRVPTFTSFTQQPVAGVGSPGGTLHLFSQPTAAPAGGQGSRTDQLELQLDLRGLPKLPAGTYRGTLTLRAVAY
jgi:hypothetical protein